MILNIDDPKWKYYFSIDDEAINDSHRAFISPWSQVDEVLSADHFSVEFVDLFGQDERGSWECQCFWRCLGHIDTSYGFITN